MPRGRKPTADEPLSQKERTFIEAYIQHGIAAEAARAVGYTRYENAAGRNILQRVHVQAEIARRRAVLAAQDTAVVQQMGTVRSNAIATRAEREERLTTIIRESDRDCDKISASKLLAQMNGELVFRNEVSGPNGSAIQLDIQSMSVGDLIKLLREVRK